MVNRLHKSESNRVIGGVCGGLGEYFGIDPTLVRVLFVVLALGNGIGILAYVVLWLVMPRPASLGLAPREVVQENLDALQQDVGRLGEGFRRIEVEPVVGETAAGPSTRDRQLVAGAVLVLLGSILLLDNLGLFRWLNPGRLWPLALILFGAYLLWERGRR